MNYINDYENMTDEELVSIIRTGDKIATDVLIKKYQNTVRQSANKFFLYGGDENDVFQEGLIGLYFAIKNFDEKNGASFKTFAKLCVERQLITAIKLSNRQKHLFLNNAISFNANIDNNEDSAEIVEVLQNSYSEDPSEIIMRKEYFKELTEQIGKKLSSRELHVLEEYKTGKSYAEIADALNCNVKAVDTALTRIRRKANKIQRTLEND